MGVKMTQIQLDTIICPRCHELVAEWGFPELDHSWNRSIFVICQKCKSVLGVPFMHNSYPQIVGRKDSVIEVDI